MDFTGKVVLITGASAGIGEATAELFAQLGASLALVGRNRDNLLRVAARCEALCGARGGGGEVLPLVADLSTDEGCELTANNVIEKFGKLHVLVNNAGVGARTNIQRTDMETYDRVFATNVRGVYNLTRLLVPALTHTRGNIVNVSSVSGAMPSVGSLPYSMSKAALDHFTKCIALELAPFGVRVNAISPGVTVSSFVTRMTGLSAEQYQGWLEQAAAGIPMGAVCVGEHIARTIAHLASEHATLLTGQILAVDGGLSLAGAGTSGLMTQQIK